MDAVKISRAGLSIFFLFLGTGVTFAEDPSASAAPAPTNFDYKTVTTKEGLAFRVPEDMPVETRGGIQAPIPFDEYMFGKFGSIDSRIKQIDDRLARIEEKLDRLNPKASDQGALKNEEAGTVLKAGVV